MPGYYWPSELKEARDEQLALRDLVSLETRIAIPPNFQNGLAIGTSYEENTHTAIAVGVWFRSDGAWRAGLPPVSIPVSFEYKPGYLAFRVGPGICKLIDTARQSIDFLLIDGQGIAHDLRFGLASHIGVLYNLPTLGVTRNPLYGRFDPPPQGRFTASRIVDPVTREHLGFAVNLEENCKPCFVSPGHNVSLADTLTILRAIVGDAGACFPSPLGRAHARANSLRRKVWTEAITE